MKKLILAALCLFALPLAAQTLGDTEATPSHPPRQVAYLKFFNGTTFDLVRGDTTNGLWVNVKTWGGTALVPGTAATNLGKAEDAGHTSGDTGVLSLFVRKDTNTQTTSADGDYAAPAVDAYGAVFSRSDHPNRIVCRITSTATTSTAVTGCAAPGAGLSIYITDINITGGVATGATAAASIQYGTGGTCGTGTTVVYDCQHPATSGCVMNLTTPIKAAANNEVCFIDATTGTKFINITGYIAP